MSTVALNSVRIHDRSILADGLIGCAWSVAGTIRPSLRSCSTPARGCWRTPVNERGRRNRGIIEETLAHLTIALTPAELETASAHATRQLIPDLVALATQTAMPE